LRSRGFTLLELLIVMAVMVGGVVVFFMAEERVRNEAPEKARQSATEDLKDIARAHERFVEVNKKRPSLKEDLLPLLTRKTAEGGLMGGVYLLAWDAPEGPKQIIAYRVHARDRGDLVCYRDLQVVHLTAEEVKAALAAK
jgi:prepilin-type N-terminal cleavage/methylation domain-containing protein